MLIFARGFIMLLYDPILSFNEVCSMSFLCLSVSIVLGEGLQDLHSSVIAIAFRLTSLLPDSPSLQSFLHSTADVILPVIHFLDLIFFQKLYPV